LNDDLFWQPPKRSMAGYDLEVQDDDVPPPGAR
jgi:hypothetical protein